MSSRHSGRVRARAGFTLIELMVTMALLGILLSLALPAYQQQQRQARRSDAQAALLQLQIDQKRRWHSAQGRFASSFAELGWTSDRSPQGHYQLVLLNVSAEGYTAEARGLGGQAQDSACQPMRLAWRDLATVVYSSGPSTDSDTARCWRT